MPFGTPAYRHLLVAAGKYGRIYLLNRDNLGGRGQGAGGSDAALRVICCFGGEWGHPAAFARASTLTTANSGTASDFLYYDGNTDYLREMRWATDSTGIPDLHTVATSSNIFHYTSGSPVVTSNGTNPTSAIVWVIGVAKSTGTGGTLYAYTAVPPKRAHPARCTKHSSSTPPADDEALILETTAEESPDAEAQLFAKQIRRRLEAGLRRLSPRQRAVFTLRHHEALSLDEIASMLDLDIGTVKVHLFRAIAKLRDELNDIYTARSGGTLTKQG